MEGRDLNTVQKLLVQSENTVALTGAGISTESGIPDFRGNNGLWTKYDLYEYGHIDSFYANPEKVWTMLADMLTDIGTAEPNTAHRALHSLERADRLIGVITQNIDGLHQKAGSVNVIELHGTLQTLHCIVCSSIYTLSGITLDSIPPVCSCGGILKPNIVLYGERLPRLAFKRALQLSSSCDTMLVIGTSCETMPAAELPYIAKNHGASVIEINNQQTRIAEIADHSVYGSAGDILTAIADID